MIYLTTKKQRLTFFAALMAISIASKFIGNAFVPKQYWPVYYGVYFGLGILFAGWLFYHQSKTNPNFRWSKVVIGTIIIATIVGAFYYAVINRWI